MSFRLNPFILLDGTAGEAIAFYQAILGAKVLFKQTVGQGPQNPDSPLSDAEKARIAHSVLSVGDTEIFVADLEIGQVLQKGNGINICLSTESTRESEQLYNALKDDGQVNVELGPVYFSPAYGMITDKYGVTFQIFTKRPQ